MTCCPLCQSNFSSMLIQHRQRTLYRCGTCQLLFFLNSTHLSPTEEQRQYDLHQNSPQDERYRKFLSQLSTPLQNILKPKSIGLDFGCGPGPTLSVMLEEAGHSVKLYDPFYEPNQSVLSGKYDFITSSEVFEHLHQPGQEIQTLINCLKRDGILAIMTQPPPADSELPQWHYLIDPTHVCFYSARTFEWIAKHWNLKILHHERAVVIFRKQDG